MRDDIREFTGWAGPTTRRDYLDRKLKQYAVEAYYKEAPSRPSLPVSLFRVFVLIAHLRSNLDSTLEIILLSY
jgi:hypothetical protein